MNAALAMIEAAAPKDETEAALAVQMACTHTAAMAVLEAQRFVYEQKGKINRLRSAGIDTSDAERTLQMFDLNLKMFKEHRDALQRTRQ